MKRFINKTIPCLLLVITAVFSATFLSGCIDAQRLNNVEKMESKGYTVEGGDSDYSTLRDGCIGFFRATKGEGEQLDIVTALFFDTESSAIDYYEISETGLIKYGLPSLKEENPELAEKFAHRRLNKIVVYGTRQAVDDLLS